jgi:acetyl-CoA carboxylase biotin carboxyl carrier protein
MTVFDNIQRMLEIMEEHGLEEFELEHDGSRVRLRKPARLQSTGAAVGEPSAEVTDRRSRTAAGSPVEDGGLTFVKSPIVGTFYHAPELGAEPFVEVGSRVRKGQILCIIEAMNLMNESDAAEGGEIVSVFIDNGRPVQYGERLFAIRPDRS